MNYEICLLAFLFGGSVGAGLHFMFLKHWYSKEQRRRIDE